MFSDGDLIVCEGTSHGEHLDGPWSAGNPEWGAGRWCDVFDIRDGLIWRCFIYLDPDYAGKDTARSSAAPQTLVDASRVSRRGPVCSKRESENVNRHRLPRRDSLGLAPHCTSRDVGKD
jgi:hypothetical protein